MRKLILVLALVSAVGLGYGRLNEDLCALGGSFADDPSTPVRVVELALPSHSQAAHKAVVPVVTVQLTTPATKHAAPAYNVVVARPLALPANPSPIRC